MKASGVGLPFFTDGLHLPPGIMGLSTKFAIFVSCTEWKASPAAVNRLPDSEMTFRTCFEMIDLKFYRRLSDCFSWILKEQWGPIVTEKYEKSSQ